jgi:hypothetical protein
MGLGIAALARVVNFDLEVDRQEMVKLKQRVPLELAPSLAVPWAWNESHFFSAFPLRVFERTAISNLQGNPRNWKSYM